MKEIKKIVLTGGPCAGKTTGMSWIVNNLKKYGYRVFVVSETAADLINGGAVPKELDDPVDFQANLYALLTEKEEVFENIAEKVPDEKVVIICDRGALDAEGFLTEEEAEKWHKDPRVNATATEMMNRYDAVFHLTTAAKGMSQYYTKENNSARQENVEEAVTADDKLITAWTGHPHFRIIGNEEDFNDKLKNLLSEILSFLGEPQPFETERKFLIEYPDTKKLESLPNCQKVEILQTYLLSDGEKEVRLRQRGDGDTFIYVKTTKQKISEEKRIETEEKLTAAQYCAELMKADTSLHQIRKTRYCLTYETSYLEIDVYPFFEKQAVMEIELSDENENFTIPDFIKVIKDVTEDKSFKNHSLAERKDLWTDAE